MSDVDTLSAKPGVTAEIVGDKVRVHLPEMSEDAFVAVNHADGMLLLFPERSAAHKTIRALLDE